MSAKPLWIRCFAQPHRNRFQCPSFAGCLAPIYCTCKQPCIGNRGTSCRHWNFLSVKSMVLFCLLLHIHSRISFATPMNFNPPQSAFTLPLLAPSPSKNIRRGPQAIRHYPKPLPPSGSAAPSARRPAARGAPQIRGPPVRPGPRLHRRRRLGAPDQGWRPRGGGYRAAVPPPAHWVTLLSYVSYLRIPWDTPPPSPHRGLPLPWVGRSPGTQKHAYTWTKTLDGSTIEVLNIFRDFPLWNSVEVWGVQLPSTLNDLR